MPLFTFGGPQFGLKDAKVATNLLNGSYGTNYDVPSVQLLSAQLNTTTAQLEGDDEITATAAKTISATVTLRFGSVPFEVFATLTGQTIESTATPGNRRRMSFSGRKMPYFGVCGKSEAAESDGETHMFIPKCKITEGFEIRFEYGAFSIPELSCMAVVDPNFTDPDGNNEIIQLLEYDESIAVALPPVF
jgi:hypothetical protein